MPVSLFP